MSQDVNDSELRFINYQGNSSTFTKLLTLSLLKILSYTRILKTNIVYYLLQFPILPLSICKLSVDSWRWKSAQCLLFGDLRAEGTLPASHMAALGAQEPS